MFEEIIKLAFINELQKLASNTVCSNCGWDSHDNFEDTPDYCPYCGEPMSTGQTAETHVNS